jgi:putative endonuclease
VAEPPLIYNARVRLTTLIPKLLARIDRRAQEPSREDAPPVSPHLALGARGEELAAEHLVNAGYRLVASNFKLNVGRARTGAQVQAEVDIVAYDGPVLCFVEVKTRRSDWFAAPEANVDLRKQRQVSRAARAYRRALGLSGEPYRFDVVSVIIPEPDEAGPAPSPTIELLRNFWTDAKFRKRRWHEGHFDN